MPLMLTSWGANGVLTDCQQAYGANRMNLFYKDDAETLQLLSDYLQLRDRNSVAVLAMFVNKLNAHRTGPPAHAIDLAKTAALDADRQAVYDSLIELFEALQRAMSAAPSLAGRSSLGSVGLGVRSFCQTWMRDRVAGNAEFSVMSPHFQTRLYIDDAAAASKALQRVGHSVDKAESLLSVHAEEMVALQGRMLSAGYAKAFVDLDLLHAAMSSPYGRSSSRLLAAAAAVVVAVAVAAVFKGQVW